MRANVSGLSFSNASQWCRLVARVVGKTPPIGLKGGVVRFEAQKCQAIVPQKRGDSGEPHLLLLDMEQQVAAAAHAKKIAEGGAKLPVLVQIQQILAAAPYVIGGCAITPLGNEPPRLHDAPPRRFTVKAHQHESAGTQQGQKHPPSGEGVGHMVQHPGTFHDIEAAADRAQLQHVRLGKFDSGQAQLPRLAPGIAKTGEAEINRQHARRHALRDFKSKLARAAAGAEKLRNFAAASALENGKREFPAQISGDGIALFDRRHSDPARVGIFFILVLDQARDRILDGGQSWNGGAQSRLLLRLAHLLHQNGGDLLGPCPLQQPGGAGKRMKRKIGRHRQQPQEEIGVPVSSAAAKASRSSPAR